MKWEDDVINIESNMKSPWYFIYIFINKYEYDLQGKDVGEFHLIDIISKKKML